MFTFMLRAAVASARRGLAGVGSNVLLRSSTLGCAALDRGAASRAVQRRAFSSPCGCDGNEGDTCDRFPGCMCDEKGLCAQKLMYTMGLTTIRSRSSRALLPPADSIIWDASLMWSPAILKPPHMPCHVDEDTDDDDDDDDDDDWGTEAERCPWGWCNGDSALHESRCLYSKMRWGVSWGWAYEKKETGELDFDRLRTAEEVEEDEKGWTILDADETDSREMIVDSDDDKV